MVRASHVSTGQESGATVAHAAGNPTPAIFAQKPHYGTFSPLKVQLCHQVPYFRHLFSGLLHDHLPLGHLWADLLKGTVAKESPILEISHLPTASGS